MNEILCNLPAFSGNSTDRAGCAIFTWISNKEIIYFSYSQMVDNRHSRRIFRRSRYVSTDYIELSCIFTRLLIFQHNPAIFKYNVGTRVLLIHQKKHPLFFQETGKIWLFFARNFVYFPRISNWIIFLVRPSMVAWLHIVKRRQATCFALFRRQSSHASWMWKHNFSISTTRCNTIVIVSLFQASLWDRVSRC